jgi:hypothetical protein
MVGASWAFLLELQSEASELKRRSTLSSGVSGSLAKWTKELTVIVSQRFKIDSSSRHVARPVGVKAQLRQGQAPNGNYKPLPHFVLIRDGRWRLPRASHSFLPCLCRPSQA